MVHAVHVNTNYIAPAVEAIVHGLKATGRAINAFLVTVMEANPRMKQIEYMQNLTDVELATKYGINRDGIAAYVFRDKMF
jgi:hypothetical protein